MKLINWLKKTPEPVPVTATATDPRLYPVVIVPTRNRPTSIRCLLAYLERFYPGARVIVADGSTVEFQVQNEAICTAVPSALDVDYRAFDPDLPLFKRIRTVLEELPEDYYVMGADDDFPVLDTLGQAKTFLQQYPDYSLCGAYNYQISMNRKGKTRTMMFNSCSIEDLRVSERCRRYADLDFPTYYCVASRSHLLSRYDRIEESFIVGFVDYMLGFHDLMRGKLKILDAVSYIRTANATHSYVRVTNRLNFLREADDILELKSQISRDLKAADGEMTEAEADQMSEDFIFERIRYLTRDRAIPDPQTPESAAYYARLEDPSSEPARRFAERIAFVEEQLRIILASEDNKGEAKRRGSLDG